MKMENVELRKNTSWEYNCLFYFFLTFVVLYKVPYLNMLLIINT